MTDPTSGAPKQGSQLPKKLAIMAVCGVLTVLLAEAAIRVYAHFSFPKLMVLDETYGWRHAPSLSKVYVNEDGDEVLAVQNEFSNRGPAYPHARTPDTHRILVLGDSFTEGVQVAEDELYTAVLESAVDKCEVINTGVGGWGTVQQFLYLRNEGIEFQPDRIIVMFYENDLDDNVMPYSPGIGDRPYARIEAGEVRLIEVCDDDAYLKFVAPVPGSAFLFEHSYLFYAFNDRLWQPPRMQELMEIEKADRDAIADDDKYQVLFYAIEQIQAVAQGAGARLDLVLIPTRQSMEAGRSERHERILDACADRGINVRSLLPEMLEAHADAVKPYFDVDIHWNKVGHRIAGEALAEFVSATR